ncbi:MAG: hypothetical protein ABIF09_12885, partial [Gemmatimonadota bacterium]
MSRPGHGSGAPDGADSMRSFPRWAFVLAACLVQGLVLAVTSHVFIADAPDYAASISEHFNTFSCDFFEFGHLLWRPMGFGLSALSHHTSAVPPTFDAALGSLTLLSVIFGFITVAAVSAWLYSAIGLIPGAVIGILFLLVSKSFINFSQVGTSYIPALAFLAVGLFLLLEAFEGSRKSTLLAVLGGASLSLAAFLWGPFLLALPGSLLSVVFLRGLSRRGVGQSLWATLAAGLTGAGVLGWAAFELRFRSLSDVLAWAGASSHGIDMVGGIPRAVIGLPRSIVHLGDLGAAVKRFLLQDPYAPVSFWEVLTPEFGPMILFYSIALLCVWLLLRAPEGRRALGLLLFTAAPLALFAISWQGGDLERYMPLMPVFSLTLGLAYSEAKGHSLSRGSMGVFLALVLLVNGALMLEPRVDRAQARPLARLSGAVSSQAARLLVVPTHQDAVWQLQRNYPETLAPFPGTGVAYLLLPGTPDVERWEETFANRSLSAWEKGVEVWFSGRLFASDPDPDWGWTEGEDPRISWEGLNDFVTQFEFWAEEDPDPESFVLLLESVSNKALLEGMASPKGITLQERVAKCSFPP